MSTALTAVLGHESDFADALHALAHADAVDEVTVAEEDLPRRRLRLTSRRGVEVALSLPRGAELVDGAVLRLDADGALVTPGFVDAHTHTTETGIALGSIDLTACRSLADLLAAVESAAATGATTTAVTTTAAAAAATTTDAGQRPRSGAPAIRPPAGGRADPPTSPRPARPGTLTVPGRVVHMFRASRACGRLGRGRRRRPP